MDSSRFPASLLFDGHARIAWHDAHAIKVLGHVVIIDVSHRSDVVTQSTVHTAHKIGVIRDGGIDYVRLKRYQ
jgi:hypothetical protein